MTLLTLAVVMMLWGGPPERSRQANEGTLPTDAGLTAPGDPVGTESADGNHGLPADPLPAPLGSPRVLITPTGVPVVVLGRTESGYQVRSPCGNLLEVAGGEPIWSTQVVVDPGHGGAHNTGARGENGLAEKDLNLTLGFAIHRHLAARGIRAVLTRTGDYGMTLQMRADLADALGAQAMVSLHHNAPLYYSRNSPGTEVHIQSDSPSSTRLGGLLFEEISQALGNAFDITWSGTRLTGVSRVLLPSGEDIYGILRRPATTTALVEYGYLANPAEARLFATEEYLKVAAAATADAIVAFLETDRPGTGFHDEPRVYDLQRATSLCQETPLE